ncbi:zinc-dependent alcohol dehydrogenase [Thermoflexus sp.]|uniref:zinc-dependent alcohol dehydrogenase n=1 Tax=Thermoflexus sp. TaxID=1969742 RepID=UPI0029956CBC|nr:alcohol dehydrogenase catalytic domain-containing protein [Thermoflexus sp.]MDW8065547.1 alcohol dehydrogenase catalytic domain-containing protein [Anaerolineae bacterium]
MRAMVLHKPQLLAVEELPLPQPSSSELLIRVTHSGICGTDQKIYTGAIPVQYPRVMGHEMIGRVVEDPAGNFAPGTRVIVDPVTFCGSCFHCLAGRTHLCPNGRLLGRDIDGGFAEFVVVPRRNVYVLPDNVPDHAAPVIQVLSTCLHAHRLASIFPGTSVVILGLGVTGLLHVQLAKARGAYPVIGVTRSAWKRKLARELGADLTFSPEEAIQGVREATEGRGADLVIESVGSIPTLAQAVELVRIAGHILVFGTITAREGSIPFYHWYFKELTILNARAAKGEDYSVAIDLVRRGVVQVEPLVTHRMKLSELSAALDLLAASESSALKIVLEHNG